MLICDYEPFLGARGHGPVYLPSRQPQFRKVRCSKARGESYARLLCTTPRGSKSFSRSNAQTEGQEEILQTPSWAGDYSEGDVLGGKYTVVNVIGRGSNGVTYKAKTRDGREVAVKALSLKRMTGWKQLELFEREAKVLESLSHPGIPQYIDYFEEDSKQDRGFFLVQELAQGKSLGELVSGGWRADESEVKRIALELLAILGYLSGRKPAVIHRDVKPENVVLEGGKSGGRVFLVDFGGVQAAASTEAFGLGSTVIGTYGFMAPESFRGVAQPASDLYALGGTLLYLLSGRTPNSFPQDRMQIQFKDVIDVSPAMSSLLEGLLEPVVEDRISADEALALLTDSPEAVSPRTSDQPQGARCTVTERRGELSISVPAAGFSADKIGLAGFAVTWNVGIGAWTASAIAAGSIVGAAFSIPFWAAGFSVAREAFRSTLRSEEIKIGPKTFSIGRTGRLSKRKDKEKLPEIQGRTRDLKGAQVITTGYVNGTPSTEIKLVEGFKEHRFGSGLTLMEQQWVASKIMSFLENVPGQPKPELPIRQKALGERITEQANRRIKDQLRQSGIDWEPGQFQQPGITWSPWDRNTIDTKGWDLDSNQWGRRSKPEYDADITWEDESKPTMAKKPDSSTPSKGNSDKGKKSDASWGNSTGLDDSDALMSDDLGLVSAPDDSITSGTSGSDSDERRKRSR